MVLYGLQLLATRANRNREMPARAMHTAEDREAKLRTTLGHVADLLGTTEAALEKAQREKHLLMKEKEELRVANERLLSNARDAAGVADESPAGEASGLPTPVTCLADVERRRLRLLESLKAPPLSRRPSVEADAEVAYVMDGSSDQDSWVADYSPRESPRDSPRAPQTSRWASEHPRGEASASRTAPSLTLRPPAPSDAASARRTVSFDADASNSQPLPLRRRPSSASTGVSSPLTGLSEDSPRASPRVEGAAHRRARESLEIFTRETPSTGQTLGRPVQLQVVETMEELRLRAEAAEAALEAAMRETAGAFLRLYFPHVSSPEHAPPHA